jgi:cysteine-rich repeat protein
MAHDRSRRRVHVVSFITATACLLPPVVPAQAAVNLSGWWRIEMPATAPPANLVHLTQTGDTVTIPVSPPLTGSVQGATLTGGSPTTSYEFRLTPAADVMDGRLVVTDPPLVGVGRLLLVRCGCNDGNAIDGDGCGADCQTEPCFTCTGDPSVCAPSPDGASCDDRHDCTAGETCSAGTCGGGSAITPCIDLTGSLDVHVVISGIIDQTTSEEVVQRDGTFLLSGSVGTVDQSAGTVQLSNPIVSLTFFNCADAFNVLAGTAGPVGFSATGDVSAPTPTQCPSFAATVTGVRTTCGDGIVQPPEQCDDDNRSPGDGCSEFCGVEKPQGGEACHPQAFCERSTKPQSTALELRNAADPAKNTVSWKWPKGTAVGTFGDPVSTDVYRLCVFDASAATPTPLFDATVPAGGTCAGKPCWKANRDKGFVYKNKEGTPDGLTALTLKAGTFGRASITVAGKGPLLSSRPGGLPPLPLPLPLLVQLQRVNGSCFEADYGADGVVRNDPASGRFKAHGTP